MNEFIVKVAVYAIPVLFAIALHEAAHGYVARYFGDSTAAEQGRLSLNPARHIDPFGTILLPLILYFTIHMPFGFAKPVPVNYARLRNPKKQMAFVAAAGPAANFAMALFWMIVLVLLAMGGAGEGMRFFSEMARAGVLVNAGLCALNLIPVPPLDGGRIVTGLLPMPLARKFAQLESYSTFIFIGLIALMYTGVLDGFLGAMIEGVVALVTLLVSPLTAFL
ncbi:site-2 protease family protein [Massilia arenosa]|uniref:Site-2 protease family protein n=1 Tax=Zemynaea arenosa TaxID=2561931 RepID=A0A4Y9SUE7_9BURK|nr:site-2 protease family protein [Massilia arenosa]TFW30048.1 site-2 protease family protein [Massilia arenosa]